MTAVAPLATERLRLRPVEIADAAALHAIYADAEAMRWWSHAAHTSTAETRDRLARIAASDDWRTWAITLAASGETIGTLGALEKRQGRVVEIGYSLARAYWGRGLAREAVAALVDRLFTAEGHRRVCADVDPDNAPSRRLLEALGFRAEGILRGEWETHLGVRDSVIYGLLADEWHCAS